MMYIHADRRPGPALSRSLVFVLAAVVGGPACVQAQVIVTTDSQIGAANVYTVSNTDLFQTNIASIITNGSFQSFAANVPTYLADGQFGPSGNIGGPAGVCPTNGATVTFNLNVTTNPGGYNITQLDSFASWDSGRDGQEYTVSFSTVAAPNSFTNLVTIPQFNPSGSGNDFHTRVRLTDQSGQLAQGVASIRYTFTNFENIGTVYREIDAYGTPVPEPSAVFLMSAVGAGGLAWCRRRRTRRRT